MGIHNWYDSHNEFNKHNITKHMRKHKWYSLASFNKHNKNENMGKKTGIICTPAGFNIRNKTKSTGNIHGTPASVNKHN